MGEPLTPNVKKLIIHRMTLILIPEGTSEPLLAGTRAFTTPGKLAEAWREAAAWVKDALAVVKSAPDNPWGDDDEAIATELVRQIEERQAAQRKELRGT